MRFQLDRYFEACFMHRLPIASHHNRTDIPMSPTTTHVHTHTYVDQTPHRTDIDSRYRTAVVPPLPPPATRPGAPTARFLPLPHLLPASFPEPRPEVLALLQEVLGAHVLVRRAQAHVPRPRRELQGEQRLVRVQGRRADGHHHRGPRVSPQSVLRGSQPCLGRGPSKKETVSPLGWQQKTLLCISAWLEHRLTGQTSGLQVYLSKKRKEIKAPEPVKNPSGPYSRSSSAILLYTFVS